jgi:hypothetical protein
MVRSRALGPDGAQELTNWIAQQHANSRKRSFLVDGHLEPLVAGMRLWRWMVLDVGRAIGLAEARRLTAYDGSVSKPHGKSLRRRLSGVSSGSGPHSTATLENLLAISPYLTQTGWGAAEVSVAGEKDEFFAKVFVDSSSEAMSWISYLLRPNAQTSRSRRSLQAPKLDPPVCCCVALSGLLTSWFSFVLGDSHASDVVAVEAYCVVSRVHRQGATVRRRRLSDAVSADVPLFSAPKSLSRCIFVVAPASRISECLINFVEGMERDEEWQGGPDYLQRVLTLLPSFPTPTST